MTREEIIDGLEIYTAGRLNKDRVHITVKELQKFIDAIKALEKEPCGDCISRKDLDKALYECFHEEDSPNNITDVRLGAVRNFIKNFQSVTPRPKWIPVSERLPESNGRYIVTEKGGRVCVYIFCKEGNSEEYWKRCVIAWMPFLLPEPWKGE